MGISLNQVDSYKHASIISHRKFFGKQEHLLNAQRSHSLLDELKNIIQQGIVFENKTAFLKTFMFHAHFYIYNYHYFDILLNKIISQEKVKKIIFYCDKRQFESNVVEGVLDTYKKNYDYLDIKIHYIKPAQQPIAIISAFKSCFLNLIRGTLFFLGFVFSIFFLKFIFNKGNDHICLVFDDAYDINKFFELSPDNIRLKPFYLSPSKTKKSFKYFFHMMSSGCFFYPQDMDFQVSKPLMESYKDLQKILQGQFFFKDRGFHEWFIPNYLLRVLRQHFFDQVFLSYIFKALKPKYVLSQQCVGTSAMLGALAKKYGIKSFFIEHGSEIVNLDYTANTLWKRHSENMLDSGYDFFLAQNQLEIDFVNFHNIQIKPIKAFPITKSVDSSYKQLDFSSFAGAFLYASSPKHGHGFRPLIYETLDEYIWNIMQVCELFKNPMASNFSLTIRHRQSKYLTIDDLSKFINPSPNITFSSNNDFYQDLSQAQNLFSYSSTCIETGFLANRNILIVDPMDKYNHLSIFSSTNIKNSNNIFHIKALSDLSLDLLINCSNMTPHFHNTNDNLVFNDNAKNKVYENLFIPLEK